MFGSIMNFMGSCSSEKQDYFAADAPVRSVDLPLPFPTNLLYQSSPDSSVLMGTRKRGPEQFEIRAFDCKTAQKLWQLPFAGTIVGQTDSQILVYEERTSTVHFVNPRDGRITRNVSPEPAPLTSPSSLYGGMAFTDDFYLTTKPLYQNVIVKDQIDTSWKIGITAKRWETNETEWFLPPVKQIVILTYAPVIQGDNVLVVNAEQKMGSGHSYQIVSLKTGREIHRSATQGIFYLLRNDRFFERTSTYVRRIDPFTRREIWRIDGNFSLGWLSEIGDQLAVLSRHSDGTQNTLRILNAGTGQERSQFNLPFFKEATLKGAYLTRLNQLLLHFESSNPRIPGERLYDYWVGYDPKNRRARWRTDFHSESFSSLLPFVTF
ncbi:hypothetical protein [Larkinella rosea]|uniref:Uncharacterized protein n=1 Tax=Larkinella rosea TaxID=2025312 RepID=A0A3P1C1G2_9BACT|nr:hypothetical protein [Larkinella rosea]RRB07260.1 hypothetical protein EHT25_05645 [Larkinella rosea]